MAAAAMKGVEALQKEFEKTKDSLKDVDENIKKLTGRDPADLRQGQVRRRSMGDETRGRGRLFGVARRSLIPDNSPRIAAGRVSRRGGGTFSRLGARVVASPLQPKQRHDSGDEEELPNKPTVQSSVVATPKDTQSREELLNAEATDEKSRTRNRRMFGLLLGTLQRFQKDEKKMEDKEAQRKAVEEKLEEKARQERKDLAIERQKLFNERKRKQQHLRRIEHKMELVAINEEWEKQTKLLMHFIRTKAKPHVYFLPKRQHANSDKKLRETRKILQSAIEERRKQLEEEIEEIMTKEEVEEKEDEEGENGEGDAGEMEVENGENGDKQERGMFVDESQQKDEVAEDTVMAMSDKEADDDNAMATTENRASDSDVHEKQVEHADTKERDRREKSAGSHADRKQRDVKSDRRSRQTSNSPEPQRESTERRRHSPRDSRRRERRDEPRRSRERERRRSERDSERKRRISSRGDSEERHHDKENKKSRHARDDKSREREYKSKRQSSPVKEPSKDNLPKVTREVTESFDSKQDKIAEVDEPSDESHAKVTEADSSTDISYEKVIKTDEPTDKSYKKAIEVSQPESSNATEQDSVDSRVGETAEAATKPAEEAPTETKHKKGRGRWDMKSGTDQTVTQVALEDIALPP